MAKQGLALDLSTLDLCFVAALHLKAEGAALASFEQDQLVDVFEQVCAAIEPDSEAVRTRATHAIRRLREQRLLARIDGAGVVRAGEYALTRLATGIVEFFLHEESLTRESLAVLIRSLLGSLNEVRKAASASKGLDAAGWRAQVVLPLRVTIGDLVSGIERRQRGFDVQQEQLQRDIAHLLEGDWFGVVERCQTLLEQTGATLSELYQVLLRDTHEVQHVLQDIEELCAAAAMGDAEQAARTLMEQNDRIAAWGSNRQRAWSEYYEYVHRYLRDVVRLDPTRTLTQRLREQLAGKRGRSYALMVAAEPSIRLLRPVSPPKDAPPVRRPRKPRDPAPTHEPAEDPHAKLEGRVREALAEGAPGLAKVTERLTAELAPSEQFVTAGRIAQIVAKLCRPETALERPWVSVSEGLWIEEWKVSGAGGGR